MEREKLVALVSAGQKGDPEALNALFNAFYNDVYYFALKTLKDGDLACDITQDTFVKIIGSLHELKEPAAFVAWMKQITYNECCRYFKKKKELLVDEDEDGNTVFDNLAEDRTDFIPHEALDQEDFRKTILSMLDRLSEEQRSAVLLYYYDELSVGQIAQIQGVSEGTVKSRLNYARKSIKASVEAYEKKHNIKLHSFGFVPFVVWLLSSSQETMPADKAAGVAGGVVAATGTALAVSSGGAAGGVAVAGTAAAVTTAATVTTAGTGAAAVISPLVIKVAAVMVAAAVTVGGVVAAVKPKDPESPTAPSHSMQQETTQQEDDQPPEDTPPENPTSETQTESTEESEETAETVETQPAAEPTDETTEATEESTEATEESTEPVRTGAVVAAGCTYILADGTVLQPGQNMPAEVSVGDQYVTGEYTYSYYYSGGWSVRVNDTAKTSYGALLSEINGVAVTDLSNCFSGCAGMTSAPAIPGTVTDLFSAFQGCASLQTAPAIPGGVTNMGQTFSGCSSLTQPPQIPSGVQVVYGLFYGCSSLTQAPALPAGVSDLSNTFRFCGALQTAPAIPAGVTNMDYTFTGCYSLQSAPSIPAGVTSMNQTFSGCSSLTAPPALPAGVTNLNSAFSGCSSLAYAPAIPAGVTNMYGLFFNCYALTGEVVIHANPASYAECFLGTIGTITLTGSSAMLQELAATGPAGNVTVG